MSEGIVTAEQVEGARRFLQMVQLSVQRQRLAPNINAGGSDPFQRSHAGVGQSYSGARNYDIVLGRKSELKFQD